MQTNYKARSCNGCDTITSNLILMPCQHRLCMSCIKNIKLPNSQSKQSTACIVCKYVQKNRTTTSPDQVLHYPIKDTFYDKSKSPSTMFKYSDISPETRFPDSYSKLNKSVELTKHNNDAMVCLEHNQVLVMYSQRAKQFLCAQCFYLKHKHSGSILPIRNAIDLISAENKANKEESKNCLNQVEAAMKVCSHNIRMLQNCDNNFRQILREQFKQLRRQLDRKQRQIELTIQQLLDQRLVQFNQIMKDLQYLKSSIKQYRQQNKQNQNINTMIFVFESYKMIKNTIKNLDMKYHQYTNTQMDLVKIDKQIFISSLDQMFKIRYQLPIKSIIQSTEQIQKQKSHKLTKSVYQQQPLKHHKNNSTQLSRQSQTKFSRKKKTISPVRSRKQQSSLCNSQPSELEPNLYERLIHQKFNKIK